MTDCKDCKVALMPGHKRCGPCDLTRAIEKAVKEKDGKFLSRWLRRNPWATAGCSPGCGDMGACHENLGQVARLLATAILDFGPALQVRVIKEADK